VAQRETIVERACEVRLDATSKFDDAALHALLFTCAPAVLIDGPAVADLHQPPRGVLDLLTFHEHGVQPLPGLRVTGFEIVAVEDDPARAEVGAHAGEHALAHRLEVAAQLAFGAIAAEHRGAHGSEGYDDLRELCDLIESD
jgi:hypothetical protein